MLPTIPTTCYHIPPEIIPEIKSHGNSKSNQPFFPTWPSTKQLIKQESEHGGPKEMVAKVSAQVGGILKAMCSGQLPRNEWQVMYLSKGKPKQVLQMSCMKSCFEQNRRRKTPSS